MAILPLAGLACGGDQDAARSIVSKLTNVGLKSDYDGDGKADIALTGGIQWSTIPVAFSTGQGAFTPTNSSASNFAVWATQGGRPITGDFNGDGRSDVALVGGMTPTGTFWNTLPVALGNANRTFTPTNLGSSAIRDFNMWANQGANGIGAKPVAGDFNGDGKTDIALTGGTVPGTGVPGSPWSSVPIAFSNGDGTFSVSNINNHSQTIAFASLATQPGAFPVADDFNGDGKADIALTSGTAWSSIVVAFSNGNGTFNVTNVVGNQHAQTFATYAKQMGAIPLAGDFDNDGKADLALTGGIQPNGTPWSSIPVARSIGDGTFTLTNLAIANFGTYATQKRAMPITGDYDGDGRTDIALTGGVQPNGTPWGSIPVARSNGDGTFVPTNVAIANFGTWATQPGARPVPWIRTVPYAVRPMAPSQLAITGTNSNWITFTFNDNNPPFFSGGHSYDLFEIVSDMAYERGSFTGSLSGNVRTAQFSVGSLLNGQSACFKIRAYNAAGESMFSNPACGSGGSMPTFSNVGLGNGVLMCDAALSNCNYFPQAGQSFKLRWAVCNAGNAASSALSVTLYGMSSSGQSTSEDFSLSGGVAAGQCVVQQTDSTTVSTSSSWHWDVYINGVVAGGLGWSF
jgi:hypothetical protein